MRRFTIFCCAAGLAGCAGSGDQTATDTAAPSAMAGDSMAAGATAGSTGAGGGRLALADLAGRWNVRSVPESGSDTSATTYVLTTTSDTTGWTVTFPNRARPIPARVVATDGDSVVTEAGPFESARRRGVQVRTRNVMRLQNGRLTGMTTARYQTTGPDSVLRLRIEGTRAP